MKTLLSQFCEEFDEVVRPLVQPITRAADTLNQVSGSADVKALLPTVLDVRHHLTTLADKVAEQQAYVLIFGPLKSGKSTLMNAISGAYVSEVTALPAYPCMVYVRDAETKAFTVTRYNGETQDFQDMDQMRTLMEWAHNELADRLREVEGRGESFDPQVHIPQAIRRVDVSLPANHLAESSASLVDTPGLYTRMKFGYDRLTREFRNSAASAIFVVKTDNLFFEQVFAEFEDLLKMFSRVFLVVNVDSTKRDLQPDGQLGPSLEGSDPERIVTAFENLTMTAPLKKARDEGRLNIYPVDLLQAASERMRGVELDDDEEGRPVGVVGFYRFLRDLSEYLNSTDYLVAFLGDSLRQAWSLVDELKTATEETAVVELENTLETLRAEREQQKQRLTAIGRLAETSWRSFFGKLDEDLLSIAGGRVEALRESTAERLEDAVSTWFEGDGSFHDLVEDQLVPVLQEIRDDLARTVGGVLETVSGSDSAGGELSREVQADLATLGIRLGQVGRQCMKGLDPVQGLAEARLVVSTAIVPVKRGLLDYLLLRRMPAVQRKLFGPADEPVNPIPRSVKARRLGATGREALAHGFGVAFNDYLNGALRHISTNVLKNYVEALRRGVRAELRKIKDSLALEAQAIERRLGELEEVSAAFTALARTVGTAGDGLADLSKRYGETDPELLNEPVELLDEGSDDDDGDALELEGDDGADAVDGDELQIEEADEAATKGLLADD